MKRYYLVGAATAALLLSACGGGSDAGNEAAANEASNSASANAGAEAPAQKDGVSLYEVLLG